MQTIERTIERIYRFEAAHQLPKVPRGHKCRRVHGHSYVIEVELVGPLEPVEEWVIDFSAIDEVAKPLIAQLDHVLLNGIEGLSNPTAEKLAEWLWKRLCNRWGEEIALNRVTVRETDRGAATIRRGNAP